MVEVLGTEDGLERMRDILRDQVESGSPDVGQLREFLDIHHDTTKGLASDEYYSLFMPKLDLPEYGLVFCDDTFDEIVATYDSLGGKPRAEEAFAKPPSRWIPASAQLVSFASSELQEHIELGLLWDPSNK